MGTSKSRLNIFLDLETMKAYLDNHIPENLEPQKVFADCAFTVDITDAPHRLFYRAGRKNAELELNRRGIMYEVEETESLKEAHLTLNPNGQVQGNAPQELQNIVQLYLMFCMNFSVWLGEQGAFGKYSGLNPETQGLMLEEKAGQIKLRPVSGDERPDLACRLFTGDVKMMRPYSADVMRGVILDAMPLEKKEAEAEAGDTKMMRHLFEYYMGNNISAHKDLERNSKKLLNLMKTASGEAPVNDEEEKEEEDTRNPEKAFYWLKKLAESGNAEAMDELSVFYMKAFGTERDLEKAAEWKKKAVENGAKGEAGMEQVLLSAAESKEKAEAGDAEAQANYAKILALFAQYRPDLGGEADEKAAFRWAQKAAAGANPIGIMTLAQFYKDGTGTSKDEKKAFRLIERAAQKGNAACQAKLGQMYFGGEGIEENPKAAFEWCKKAAEAGDVNGMSNLGVLYLLGKGVEKNPDKAAEWLQKAAALGDDGAKMALEKLGIPLNPQKDDKQPRTVEEAIQMAEQGSVGAMKMLAGYYINRPGEREDLVEAEKWAKMAADRGDEEAKETLRQLQNVKEGKLISFEDAKRDAENGHPGAQKILADYYATGYKTPRDLVKARYWMKKAAAGDARFAEQAQDYVDTFADIEGILQKAAQGDSNAQAQLAEKYLGISQALEYNREEGQKEAFKLAKRAADQGDALGLFVLGSCFENGYGTEADLDKAFYLYKQSAESGNPRGELSLSQAYLTGRGTEYDVDAAIEWFYKAEGHGNPEAEKARELYPQLMLMMAIDMLGTGEKSGRADPVQGAKYMQHAAELGNADAQHLLGIMLANGNNVEQDFEKGIEWLHKSAENGNAGAVNDLKKYDRPEIYYKAALFELKRKDRQADNGKMYRLFKKAAEAGYAPAMANYGYYLILGVGGELDYEEGLRWIKRGAELGEDSAKKLLEKQRTPDALNMAAMAQASYAGKKGLTDFSKAHELFRQAAEAGSAEACNTLGVLYADPEKAAGKFGRIGDRNFEQARNWFEKALAIKPDLVQAQNNLKKLADVIAAEKDGKAPDSELKWVISSGRKKKSENAPPEQSDSVGKAQEQQMATEKEPKPPDAEFKSASLSVESSSPDFEHEGPEHKAESKTQVPDATSTPEQTAEALTADEKQELELWQAAEKTRLAAFGEIGETVYFGHYLQNAQAPEDIEWVVLDTDGNNSLLISKYALDCHAYKAEKDGASWKSADLRLWLNDTFLQAAFTPDEQSAILETGDSASPDPAGRVHVLTRQQAETYYIFNHRRTCLATAHAEKEGAYIITGRNCWWWLKDVPEDGKAYAVDTKGCINAIDVDYQDCAIRPVIWIDRTRLEQFSAEEEQTEFNRLPKENITTETDQAEEQEEQEEASGHNPLLTILVLLLAFLTALSILFGSSLGVKFF